MVSHFPVTVLPTDMITKTLFSPSRNAKQMPEAVGEALKSVFQSEGGLSALEAEEHLTSLERVHRFQAETWS